MARTPRSALIRSAGCLALAAVGILGSATPAAADPPVGVPAAWTLAGGSGTVALPGVSGFPIGAVATDGGSASVPSGASAYLGPATPYGTAFGSTRGHQYLTVGTKGSGPSITTITFPTAAPTGGWGFALGDVDADRVQIQATGAGGQVLAGAALGFQGTFNACDASPRPSSCSPPYTDVPSWDEASSTLTGSGSDTSGATGWFRPTAAVTGLTFTFSLQVGSPIYQLWISGLTASASGTVAVEQPDPPSPAGATVELRTPAGEPVPGPDGDPVAVHPAEDGTFTLPDLLAAEYVAHVEPPAGVDADPLDIPVDLRPGDVTDIAAVFVPARPATTTTTTTGVPSTAPPRTPTSVASPTPAGPAPPAVAPTELPRTGSSSTPLAAIGAGLLAGGAAALRVRRRFTRALVAQR